jgi:hypothetical protein
VDDKLNSLEINIQRTELEQFIIQQEQVEASTTNDKKKIIIQGSEISPDKTLF